jgi:hypothetical protein
VAKMMISPVPLFNSISLLEKGVEVGLKGHRGLERKGREMFERTQGVLRERGGEGFERTQGF